MKTLDIDVDVAPVSLKAEGTVDSHASISSFIVTRNAHRIQKGLGVTWRPVRPRGQVVSLLAAILEAVLQLATL
jgi:hypothetical protein